MAATWVAIAAIVLSTLTFVASQREFKSRAKSEYVEELEHRLADQEHRAATLEERVRKCEEDRATLREDNARLVQRVLRLESAR